MDGCQGRVFVRVCMGEREALCAGYVGSGGHGAWLPEQGRKEGLTARGRRGRFSCPSLLS